MKCKSIFFFYVLFFLIFTSCDLFPKSVRKDSELITDFVPLEWSDDFVFGATQYPPRISLWDSKTCKLVMHYDFFRADNEAAFFNGEGSWLSLITMLVVDKTIWCIALGNQCSLVKIDIETGKIKFIDLEKKYDYLEVIPEVDNGKPGILVIPFAQYMADVDIKLFSLDGVLLHKYGLSASDLHILSAAGQYKDNCYYFCAGSHLYEEYGEPSSEIFKVVKLNLLSDEWEVIPLNTVNILGKEFMETNISQICNSQYSTSFSVKPGYFSDGKFAIALDFIGEDIGRFLFETDDLLTGVYSYTGKNIIYSVDNVKIFPRMYFKIENQYSLIGNYSNDLYAVFFDDSRKDIFYMPNTEIIFMDSNFDEVWCAKNSYSYLDKEKTWIYDGEGIYRIDLKNKSIKLYSQDGSVLPLTRNFLWRK